MQSGLEGCTQLEVLLVAETALGRIAGLERCPRLRNLSLFANNITSITGLDTLTVGFVQKIEEGEGGGGRSRKKEKRRRRRKKKEGKQERMK